MFFKKYKKFIIFTMAFLISFSLTILLFSLGSSSNLKYLELNNENQVQLKGEYIDIEGLFNEERYTKDEIKKVKKYAKEYDITPEEFVFVSLINNGGYELNFEDIDNFDEKIKELEKRSLKTVSELYKEYCKDDIYLDPIIRAKLSDKKEITDEKIIIDDIFHYKKVKGVASSGFVTSSFKTIVIDDKITEIGAGAFASSSVQFLHLGEETLIIGENILSGCNAIQYVYSPRFLGEFTIAENNTIFNDVYIYAEE